jgi:hypothetical protein
MEGGSVSDIRKNLAFPHSHLGIDHGKLSHQDSDYEDGMTTRQYAAIHLLAARVSNRVNYNIWDEARHAVKLADALLQTEHDAELFK